MVKLTSTHQSASFELNNKKKRRFLFLLPLFIFAFLSRNYAATTGTLAINTAPVAATYCAGTTNQIIYSFKVTATNNSSIGTITISNLSSINITGFSLGDISNLKLWYNTSNSFTTANSYICSHKHTELFQKGQNISGKA